LVNNRKYGKSLEVDKGLVAQLKNYHWPGNIREFQHAVERAVILCEEKRLSTKDFQFPDQRVVSQESTTNLNEVERKTIAEAIRKHGGNMSKAAKALGLGRTTLYRKIEKYGL
ncbi:MAG: helix-turn-helix domain-containing protein, partial [Cyclobacteriaceae bacterium]